MITVSKLTIPFLAPTIAFLEPYEETCVNLMSNIVRNGQPCLPPPNLQYYVLHEGNSLFGAGNIRGVVSLSTHGMMLYHIDNPQRAHDLAAPLAQLLDGFELYCLLGDAAGAQFIKSLLYKRPRTVIDYTLMIYSGPLPTRGYNRLPSAPPGTALHQCTGQDANALFHLAEGYDHEERLPPGTAFYPAACMKLLEESLATETVFALSTSREVGKPFIAMARTNAVGKNWVQLGGVYTQKNYRGKGYAGFLVGYLAQFAALEGKRTALFVKNHNTSARSAYARAGFKDIAPFQINYFE